MFDLADTAAAIVTFSIALLGVPLVRRAMLRMAIVDAPNARSSHSGVIPRGGGVALMIAMLVGIAITGPDTSLIVMAAGATVLGVVGLVDDRADLSVKLRLGLQLLVAVVVSTLVFFGGNHGIAAVALALAGIVGFVAYVNAFNFMDGINGISAAQAITAGSAFAVLGGLRDIDSLLIGGLVLAAAFLAFVPFNAPRAVIFLGDVGSYFAGFWIAGLIVLSIDAGVPAETALVPVVLWLTDTGATLFVRLRNGQRIGEAHSDHAYQRLARAWRSHGYVAITAAIVIATTSALAILVHDRAATLRIVMLAFAVAASVGFVAIGRRAESMLEAHIR